MQHNLPARNLAPPSFSSSWRPSLSRSTAPATQDRWASAQAAQEEAWTQYDDLGPVRPDRELSRNWRSRDSVIPPSFAPNRGGRYQEPNPLKGPRGNHRQRPRDDSRHSSPPPKRNRGAPSHAKTKPRVAKQGDANIIRIDDDYLTQRFTQIMDEEYGPDTKLLVENPKAFLSGFKGIKPKSSKSSHKGGIYRCTVTIDIPEYGIVKAYGDSANEV
jgi:ATP-dependent RNA helicase DHX36